MLLPAQTLGELYRVLNGKAKRHVADHGMQIWDALIVSVASENRRRLLLSEDLQNGFAWGGVTVVNPLATPRTRLFSGILHV